MSNDFKNKIKSFAKNNRIIVCSNRGPFTFQNIEGKIQHNRSGGGLVSALLSIKDINFTWIAVAQNKEEKKVGLDGIKVNNFILKFINVPNKEYHCYYNKICNQIFWYTQHGLWDNVYNPSFNVDLYSDWKCYQDVNKKFAEAIASDIGESENTHVMVQDYHLYLVPKLLRKLNKKVVSNFFVHIPWPNVDSWYVLPDFIIRSVISSLLESNIVAFHCYQYASNFYSTVNRYTGLSGDIERMIIKNGKKDTNISYFPISIDVDELINATKEIEFDKYVEKIKKSSKGKIIVRVDRADLSKNIYRGFLAYEKLLERRKDLNNKVTFIAMLYSTRTEVTDYNNYLEQIRLKVESINKKFGNANWNPVVLRIADNYIQSLAALSIYDVLLVNPIADGMNLVAKEGPLINNKNGTLILSNLCGAHNELGGFCLSINPFDIAQTASAMEKALILSDKARREKAECLKNIIIKNNSRKWLYYNIEAMEKVKELANK